MDMFKISAALEKYEGAVYGEGNDEDEGQLETARSELLTLLRQLKKDSDLLDWLGENFFHREMSDWDAKMMPNVGMWVFFTPTNSAVNTAAKTIREHLENAMFREKGEAIRGLEDLIEKMGHQ